MLMLKKFNDLGLLMHYNEKNLRELVVFKPQWLLNRMRDLFCLRGMDKQQMENDVPEHIALVGGQDVVPSALAGGAMTDRIYGNSEFALAGHQRIGVVRCVCVAMSLPRTPVQYDEQSDNDSPYYGMTQHISTTPTFLRTPRQDDSSSDENNNNNTV